MEYIDIERLALAFSIYMKAHPAAELVADCDVSFESWFRVELAAALMTLGIRRDQLDFRCPYPQARNQREKADLMVRLPELAVFELKCFVCGADVQKLSAFPGQILRLQKHVASGTFKQAVAFVTIYGYRETKVSKLVSSWFPNGWKVVGPLAVVDGHPLRFVLAETRSWQ